MVRIPQIFISSKRAMKNQKQECSRNFIQKLICLHIPKIKGIYMFDLNKNKL